MELFKDTLKQQFGFSDEASTLTANFFIPEKIEARECFIQQGKIADKLGLVTSGLLRSFLYDENANEITLHFCPIGTVAIVSDSFNNRVPAEETIIAFEDSELLTITYKAMQELYRLVPAWQVICREVADNKNKALKQRTLQFQTLSAKERYLNYVYSNPNCLKKSRLLILHRTSEWILLH